MFSVITCDGQRTKRKAGVISTLRHMSTLQGQFLVCPRLSVPACQVSPLNPLPLGYMSIVTSCDLSLAWVAADTHIQVKSMCKGLGPVGIVLNADAYPACLPLHAGWVAQCAVIPWHHCPSNCSLTDWPCLFYGNAMTICCNAWNRRDEGYSRVGLPVSCHDRALDAPQH